MAQTDDAVGLIVKRIAKSNFWQSVQARTPSSLTVSPLCIECPETSSHGLCISEGLEKSCTKIIQMRLCETKQTIPNWFE
jgi:hypothetical protein